MLNLLFISDNACAEELTSCFQRILTIRVDIAADFDQGLKEVFEKRPFAVCIQDELDGVTGESVARHIQLLLGNKAPSFVLMHGAKQELQSAPGLFERVLDLHAPFDTICNELGSVLRQLLGEQWSKVYSPVEGMELLFDDAPEVVIQQNEDVDTLCASVGDQAGDAIVGASLAKNSSSWLAGITPAKDGILPGESKTGLPFSEAGDDARNNCVQEAGAVEESSLHGSLHQGSSKIDELLQNFEENYRARQSRIRSGSYVLLGTVLVVLLAWLGWNSKDRFRIFSATGISSRIANQQPLLSSEQQMTKAGNVTAESREPALQIPSFVPRTQPDTDFSKGKPGWTRYLTEKRDYRLYHVNTGLQALQVLAVGNDVLAEQELQQALKAIEGGDTYQILNSDSRDGVITQRAVMSSGAELLVYRLAKNGGIRAFVIAPKKRGN